MLFDLHYFNFVLTLLHIPEQVVNVESGKHKVKNCAHCRQCEQWGVKRGPGLQVHLALDLALSGGDYYHNLRTGPTRTPCNIKHVMCTSFI